MTDNILTKKGLKNFVHQNGFFLQVNDLDKIKTNEIDEVIGKLDDAVKTGVKLPENRENIQVFRGLASQYYGKGKKSRNGYKYDHKGMDLTNYKKNPLILLGHDSNKPIGKCLSLHKKDGVGLEIVYFVDYDTKNAKEHEHELRNGYIGMLSTGAKTDEWMVEDNKTGERMTPREADEAGVNLWAVYFGDSDDYTMVITKSQLIENSQVTIGSNEDAETKSDSLGLYFKNQLEKMGIKNDGIGNTQIDELENNTEAEPETPAEIIEETETVAEAENAEAVTEEAENAEEVETAEVIEEATEEVPAENVEADEEVETPAEPTVKEDSLKNMTLSLAKNLLKLENEVSEKKSLTTDEVQTLIDTKLNTVIADQNSVIEKMAENIVSLSNQLKQTKQDLFDANTRMDSVAVNRPLAVHAPFANSTKKAKQSWA